MTDRPADLRAVREGHTAAGPAAGAGPADLRAVREGHAANCSAAGSIVGAALLTVAAVGVIVNAFADRFARATGGTPPGAGAPAPDGSARPPPGRDDAHDVAPRLGRDPRDRTARDDGAPDDAHGGPIRRGDDAHDVAPRLGRDPRDQPARADGAAPPARLRPHGDGAIVPWADPPALLHLGPAGRAAALAAGAVALPPTGPLELHLAVTDRCAAPCPACYLDARPSGAHADPADLLARVDALPGALAVAVGGGEPLSHPGLLDVLDGLRARGLTPNLTTSGIGLTDALARALAARVGQVQVSVDGLDGFVAARGYRPEIAWTAIRRLREAGVRVGVNTVLRRRVLDELDALADRLVDAGVAEWQWLRLKPAGRGDAAFRDESPSPAELVALWPRLLAIEARTGLRMRVDCAMIPFLAAAGVPVEHARRLGVLGCAAADEFGAVAVDGRVLPCSSAHGLVPDGPGGGAGWDALARWRDRPPPAPCATCDWRAVCRGGCRVVAAATGDAFAPDPQCPRVLAHG